MKRFFEWYPERSDVRLSVPTNNKAATEIRNGKAQGAEIRTLFYLVLRKYLAVWGVRAAKSASEAECTFSKTAAKHLTEVVKRGENAGQLARPNMNSPLTVREIMSTGKGTLDATFKGRLNWRVPGTFRRSQGIWKLGINPKTKVI